MAYNDLSTEQKQSVDDFMSMLRPWCGEFARVHNHGAACYTQYWANIRAIMGDLQDADVIPNKSGLPGAVGITKTEIGTVLAWIGDVATTNSESNRQLMAKSCGAHNLIG